MEEHGIQKGGDNVYTVEFVNTDGNRISFDNVTKIQYGKSIERLSQIEDCKILTEIFFSRGYFKLTSDSLNVSYHDENTVCVIVKKVNA